MKTKLLTKEQKAFLLSLLAKNFITESDEAKMAQLFGTQLLTVKIVDE